MVRASCLCGAIRLEIDGDLAGVGLCHCSLCRKVSGSASTATIPVAAERLRWIAGRELIRSFRRPSGYTNVFCGRCGSPVPDSNTAQTRYTVPAGMLDDRAGTVVVEHIHVASKAGWDVIGDTAPQFATDGPPMRPARPAR